MDDQSIRPTVQQIESQYSILNERFYGGELPKPVITVFSDSKRKGILGWCTIQKMWKTGKNPTAAELQGMSSDELQAYADEGFYEINICAEYLTRPIDEVCETILHEMVHLYNAEHGIEDTSRNGYYHNKRYKETASAHGLIVEKTKKYGYSQTSLSEEAKQFIQKQNFADLTLCRKGMMIPKVKNDEEQGEAAEKKKTGSRKYVCPVCGDIVRATKAVRIGCLNCNAEMIET
ncbi:MAG: hypothetical protein BACD_00178 [Bacteroides rodentium]